ncbi:MAG: hypothetical protein ACJ790_04855 [Myxococcaceae bacterium]
MYVEAKAGEEKFQRLNALEWTEVETKDIAEVEALPSGEALITGKRPGATLVLLYAEGKMGVWRVSVTGKSDAGIAPPDVDEYVRARAADLLAAAKKACPDLKQDPGSSDEALVVTVKTDACRSALKALFQTDAFNAREISLTYDLPVLQTQLKEMQSAIDAAIGKGKVTSVYSGAGLRLSGKITTAEHRKVLWALFKNSVGRVALEDRLELTDKPPPPKEDEKESP